jgi:DNA-binding NarL/FixJ family response regulator
MTMHTVLVAYQNEVFARGVMGFLKDVPGIEVVRVTNDLSAAVETARSLHADVVILEGAADERENKLQAFLGNPSTRRVVALSLDNLVATVYEVKDLPMPGPSALVSAIRGEAVSGVVVN